MRLPIACAILLSAAAPVLAQPTVVCSVGQPCVNGNPVPFPVINPAQGLAHILKPGEQPPPQTPYGGTPVATPPPVMPQSPNG